MTGPRVLALHCGEMTSAWRLTETESLKGALYPSSSCTVAA
jgi:hypothetical protein